VLRSTGGASALGAGAAGLLVALGSAPVVGAQPPGALPIDLRAGAAVGAFEATQEFDGQDWQDLEEGYGVSGTPWPGPWAHIEESVHPFMESSVSCAERNHPVGRFHARYGG
jgi:hypothetical protein